ncbi:tRNA dihydrouridine synthase DusB, partial [Thermodesulfobacteriota bacterium]
LGVQIFGTRPEAMAGAAKMVEDAGADLLDINMGCPVKKVCRNGAGAALMREPEKIRSILEAVRRATSLPVTVKMRAGWDSKTRNALEIAKITEEMGADGLVIHPRTRAQAFSGSPDIDLIRTMVETVSIPVIGNGGVIDPASALAMLADTGCAGIMIGRGALGKPWIFNAILESIRRGEPMAVPPPDEVARMMMEHIRLEVQRIGERQAVLTMRKHLCWYSKGLPGGTAFRKKVNEISSAEDLLQEVGQFARSIH